MSKYWLMPHNAPRAIAAASIWLSFLSIPAVAVVTTQHGVRLLASCVFLLVFAATYLIAVTMLEGAVERQNAELECRVFIGGGVCLLGEMLVGYLLMGNIATGLSYYVLAWITVTMPLRVVVPATLAAALCTFILPPLDAPLSGRLGMILGLFFMVTSIFSSRSQREFKNREVQWEKQQMLAQERERMARDVHDVLGHTLTAVTLKAQVIEAYIDRDAERAKSEAHAIQALSRQGLAEIRATVSGLRATDPATELTHARETLDSAGIALTVALAEGVDRQARVVWGQSGDESSRRRCPEGAEEWDATLAVVDHIDPQFRTIAAWTICEAVTNVARHAQARRCRMIIGSDWIEIADDGVGMSAHADSDDGLEVGGFGLKGLRERVSAAGGTVTVSRVAAGEWDMQGDCAGLSIGEWQGGTCLQVALGVVR